MNDVQRNKYEILDLIFAFLIAICMLLTNLFLLSNLIVSAVYAILIVLFALVILFFWMGRNPFNIYLIRTLAFSNFIFTFISLIIFFVSFTPASIGENIGYIILLFPSGIYLLISFKFSSVTTPSDKKEGAVLALTGFRKASRRRLFRDDPEERIKQEELIAKQKKAYKYNLIIGLCITIILSSLPALILGFV